MDCQLREQNNKKVLLVKGYQSDGTYYSFLNTKQAFGLKPNEPITVKMVLKTGGWSNSDYIKIMK